MFLLVGETTSQGNKEPVTCCTAESTVCCTDRSVFLGERLVSAMSEPPFTGALSPTVGSGTNCIPGMADGTDGGAWTTSFRARVTVDARLLDRVDSKR